MDPTAAAADPSCPRMECGTSRAEEEYDTTLPTASSLATPPALADFLASVTSVEDLRRRLAMDVVTQGPTSTTFTSPFGDPTSSRQQQHALTLPLVYCDQTASNRPLQSLEDYLQKVALPLYGNTHTTTSLSGAQATALVAEARQLVAEAVNAKITGKASLDVVLFAGHGTTAAVELLIDGLGLKHASERPLVFSGPYEHHSNLVPWREAGCRMVMVPESARGGVDLAALERVLQTHQAESCLKMGTFSVASNVTGQVCDGRALAALLHRYGALAFFDYATAAPYVSMDMNPPAVSSSPDDTTTNKNKNSTVASVAADAIFFSPHKCLGGVGTPGVLVCKKHLLSQTNAPGRSGGGTVFYVTHADHRFLSNRLERYEGGTPHVVGIWRAGLTMMVKRRVAQVYAQVAAAANVSHQQVPRTLVEFEYQTYQRVATYVQEHAPNLVLLGYHPARSSSQPHLPIFSFLIRCGSRFLHYNYVCAILNDVFGIQSRGGCQCAGPYSQRLLGLTTTNEEGLDMPSAVNRRLEQALLQYKERAELLRPGYSRLSLPFKGVRPEEVDYVCKAMAWVSKHAWALMCVYRCNHRTGEWRHHNRQGKPLGRSERRWLSHYMTAADPIPKLTEDPADYQVFLDESFANADRLLETAKSDQKSIKQALKMTGAEQVLHDLEDLRWYVYPQECAQWLSSQVEPPTNVPLAGPFDPYPKELSSPLVAEKATVISTKAVVELKRKMEPVVSDARLSTETDGSVAFRDNETEGRATLVELDQRIRKGDLSDECRILNNDSGEWVPLRSLIGQSKKQKTLPQQTKTSGLPKEESLTASETKKPAKKQARDSSAWGVGSVAEASIGAQPVASTHVADAAAGGKPSGKSKKFKHQKPPAKMMKLVKQAIFHWDMIENGDRLLLGLSGGKDSLSLLHCLLEFRRKVPIHFDLEVCTIDPMTPSFDPSPLIPYVESLGLKHHYVRDDIVARANTSGKDGKMVASLCAFCARMKRGNLYTQARKNNCNKLVLAQHLDDCAESFIMSLMHNGFLRTMKANYTINEGDLSVIRPMVYCRESLMTDFAKSTGLPVINENCPACFEEPKERARVKKLLSREELSHPNFYDNIRRSLLPLMHGDMEAILHRYTEDVVTKVRKRLMPSTKVPGTEPSVVAEEKKSEASLPVSLSLTEASEADLLRELARRKAQHHRLAGAAKRRKIAPKESDDAASADALSAAAAAASATCTIDGACSFFD